MNDRGGVQEEAEGEGEEEEEDQAGSEETRERPAGSSSKGQVASSKGRGRTDRGGMQKFLEFLEGVAALVANGADGS